MEFNIMNIFMTYLCCYIQDYVPRTVATLLSVAHKVLSLNYDIC
jgi:hypothetical protein